jgi:hypothetical protein
MMAPRNHALPACVWPGGTAKPNARPHIPPHERARLLAQPGPAPHA